MWWLRVVVTHLIHLEVAKGVVHPVDDGLELGQLFLLPDYDLVQLVVLMLQVGERGFDLLQSRGGFGVHEKGVARIPDKLNFNVWLTGLRACKPD